MQSANQTVLRAEYANTVATNQSDTVDQYHAASVQEQTAENNLKNKTSAAEAEVKQVAADRRAVANSQTQMESTLSQDKGRIAVLVAQQRAAEEAAARAAAQARLAAQRSRRPSRLLPPRPRLPQRPRRQPPGTAGPRNSVRRSHPGLFPREQPGPCGRRRPAGRQRCGRSRPGGREPRRRPLRVGSGRPLLFDCSGLVMWAYAQVGISLPHFSGAQYADTTHISMSDLEPGDLVFPADPGQHVAMYVGGGMIVQAPFTGEDVQVIPLSSFFVLASRVA